MYGEWKSLLWEGLAEKAKDYEVRVVVIKPGQSIKEGNMTVTCIQPGNPGAEAENKEFEGRDAEEGYEPGNAASMVLAVKSGEFEEKNSLQSSWKNNIGIAHGKS